MSTKIYNGFTFVLSPWQSTNPFGAVLNVVESLRHTLRPKAERLLAAWMIRRAIELMDRHLIFPPDTQESNPIIPLSQAYQELHAEQRAGVKDQARHPDTDMSFSLTLFPGSRRRLYGIAYTEQPLFMRAWRSLPAVHDYSYWDNTDPPEHLSARAWSHRKECWDQIFRRSGIPQEAGFGIVVLPEDLDPSPNQVRRSLRTAVPPLTKRARRIALDLTLKEVQSEPYTRDAIPSVFRALMELEEGRSPHQAVFVRHYEATLQRLNPTPTFDELRSPLK